MIKKRLKNFKQRGFSVLEIVLAAAVFMYLGVAAVVVVINGINANRLGAEFSVATQFAAEGIEAMKSIKNQAYTNLVNTTGCGLVRNVSNVWAFQSSCSNNTLVHNASDNYIRTVKVESVNRDAVPPAGNIVASGGTLDPDSKKITSTVTWNFNPGRAETISLISYLSDWRKAITGVDGGLLVYGNTTTTPKYRTYSNTNNNFSAETNTVAGASGLTFQIKTSPTKHEAVAGYVSSTGVLQIMCFDGTTWTNEWTVTVGGTGTTRRFDIEYETSSGDAMVLYSTNAGTNELGYRTKLGSAACGSANWAAATTFDSPGTTGVVQWIKMARDRRSTSNLITAIWADANSDLQAAIWSGTAWVQRASALETSLEVATAAQDVDDFDVEYESLSGDVMVVWANSAGANGTNGVRYATCPGGTSSCTWGSVTTPPTFLDDATNLDISANPNTDEMVFASIGNAGSDLQIGYWSGSAWTDTANVDITADTPLAGTHLVTTGWLISGSTTRSIVVYQDSSSTGIDWYVGNAGTFTVQTDCTTSGGGNCSPATGAKKWLDIRMDPINKDRLLLTLSDTNSDLFAKRLVMTSTPAFTWTNSDGGAALQLTLGQAITSPFGFAYWLQ